MINSSENLKYYRSEITNLKTRTTPFLAKPQTIMISNITNINTRTNTSNDEQYNQPQ